MVKDARTWLDEINAAATKRGRLKIFRICGGGW